VGEQFSGESCSKASRDSNESGALSFASARRHAAFFILAGLFSGGVKARHFCHPIGRLSFFGIGLR
jgi:hypothetical protein